MPNSFATPWTTACQAPLSMGFSRQDYWSGLPCPPPEDLPDPGIEPTSPALAGGLFTTEPTGNPHVHICIYIIHLYTYINKDVYMYMWGYVCIWCVYIYIYIHIHVDVCISIYLYIYFFKLFKSYLHKKNIKLSCRHFFLFFNLI